MEIRKQKEIEHYDKSAGDWFKTNNGEAQEDVGGFSPVLLKSHKFLRKFLKNKCENKKILDYGCGNGIHSDWLAQYGEQVIGIDLSKNSLEIARKKIEKEGLNNKVKFLVMDCEKMDFPDNYFDIVFNGGTFSSLDLLKVFPEINRVLKPDGFLIGIETLGHNPFTNFKRKINKLTKKRTKWAVEHIFKIKDLKLAKKYFNKTESRFFHLISWIAFPFLNLPGGKILLGILETIDELLIFIFPFIKRYCFKIVFIFSQPKKIKEGEKK